MLAPGLQYPTKPVRVLMPFAARGGIDLFARILAKRMQESMGQNVIVDNRPGAGGNIGAELLAKSPADGYTLMVSSAAVAITSNALFWGLFTFAGETQIVQMPPRRSAVNEQKIV